MNAFLIKSVALSNFKKHKNLTVHFNEGTTVIRGPNYSGKSSVIQGIFYALFGPSAVPGGKALAVNRDSKTCCVTLEFTTAGATGQIVRSPNTALVTLDSVTKATGHTSVNAWVEELFGMPEKQVLMLARSSQGETQALMSLGAPALNRIVEAVGNTKYVDELADKASKIASKAKSSLDNLAALTIEVPEVLQQTIELTEEELADDKVTLTSLTVEKETLEEVKTNLSSEIRKINSRNWEISEEKKKHNEDLEQLARVATSLENVTKNITDTALPDISKLTDRLKEVAERCHILDGVIASKRNFSSGMKKAKEHIANYKLQELKEENVRRLSMCRQDLEEVKNETTERYSSLQQTNKDIADLTKDLKNSTCSACNRPFDESHVQQTKAKLQHKTEQLKAYTDSFNACKKHYDDLKAQVAALELIQPTPSNWKELLADQEHIYTIAEAEFNSTAPLEDLEGEWHALVSESGSLKTSIRHAEEIRSKLDGYRTSLHALEVKKAELEKKLESYVVEEPVNIQDKQDELTKVNEALTEIQNRITDCKFSISNHQREVAELRDRLATARGRLDIRSSLERRHSRFTGFTTWLRANKTKFLEDTWAGILGITTEFTYNCTNGAITQVLRDSDGEFSYVEDGIVMPMQGASGGQQSIMGVGLRLALASLLPQGCGLVALDEPTSELNDEHAAQLTAALSGQGRQVVMTTHRSGDEFVADEVVVIGD